MTLEGHDKYIRSISYFPDGRRMISGSWDKTARQWDLQAGKEIEGARNVCERGIWVVAVSKDGRWAITGGGGLGHGELKVIEVETGIVTEFESHSRGISCIDISADSKFLASGSWDRTMRIWSLGTGKLVAGPFESIDWVGAVRFSPDSKKLVVKSQAGKCLEVWDVHKETLDVRVGEFGETPFTSAPVFWTNRNKTIVAAFTFTFDDATTIYEFDALTLETVGAPFEAHTKLVRGLALSFDDTFLASAADDNTIKVWAFESRQLLASFNARTPETLILSPDSSQLAYTTGRKIYICNIPLDVLASTGHTLEVRDGANADKNSRLDRLLNSHATRRPPIVPRHQGTPPAISFTHRLHRPPPKIDPQQPPVLLRHLRKILHFSSRAITVPPVWNDQTHDRLDFPATSPLPSDHVLLRQPITHPDDAEAISMSNRSAYEGSQCPTRNSCTDDLLKRDPFHRQSQQAHPEEESLRRSNGAMQFLQQHLSFYRSTPVHEPPVVEVAAGHKFTVMCIFLPLLLCLLIGAPQRLAVVKVPEYIKVDDTRCPLRQQLPVSQDMARGHSSSESSDIDSLPDVHWCKAFFCYYSCWSHGRLRMPPRWRLESVDPPQDSTTRTGRVFKSFPTIRVGYKERKNFNSNIQTSNADELTIRFGSNALSSESRIIKIPAAAATNMTLTPVLTLEGHEERVRSISYFPDGKQMISGSMDKTARRWDLRKGKEIEEVRDVCEQGVYAVVVSKDGRWVITAGGNFNHTDPGEIKAYGVETGIMKTFQGHARMVTCIDSSTNSTLLASGSWDGTARVWSLDTGKLVAGPFDSIDWPGAVLFSPDSKKLAVKSEAGKCIEIWDVQTQKLDGRIGGFKFVGIPFTYTPLFWTNKNKNILAAFSFTDDVVASTIYEFDAMTLQTSGVPFEGHTKIVTGLALSFDGTLLASASDDNTIKLWAFESRQLFASFNVQNPFCLTFSPDSRQLAYTTYIHNVNKIIICNTPRNILSSIGPAPGPQSDATRRSAVTRRNLPTLPVIARPQRSLPAVDPRQPIFLHIRKLLRLGLPVRNDQPRDPLDFPATLPLPQNLSPSGHSDADPRENSRAIPTLPTTRSSFTVPTVFTTRPNHLRAGRAPPPFADVPYAQAKERNAAAGAPKKDDNIVPDEYLDPPSPHPDSQEPAAAVQPNTGEHGSDRSCFCF
ncbi:WD40 repeat-like protein [Suillus weaverae]|nr:WD40 repeat-like protein [Suillus weaverae]